MRLISAFAALLLPLYAHAFSPSGLRFEYKDWELACDNSGTCRAAGYYAVGGDKLPISILLTRKAGPKSTVSAQIMLELSYGASAGKLALELKINDKPYDQVLIDPSSMIGELSLAQVDALLASLPRHANIGLNTKSDAWQISDLGAAAVLLKMDEYQGRIGTPGALVNKGTRPEASVPPAMPLPTVIRAKYAKPQPGDAQFLNSYRNTLLDTLRSTVSNENCGDLQAGSEAQPDLKVQRLSARQMLVSTQCWAGRDVGRGFWIVNQKPPFLPILISTEITDAQEPELMRTLKGAGDYWQQRTYTWDGNKFQITEESVTGSSRPMKAGGGWTLPTVVTNVR